ncbi:ComEC/Rec2 family competence protein [Rhodanobacter aciditrophus]|uniref:ComEC/Rec2 family competence protein n=1 Tax=Rhodanobacter aciditrophus TaxID=1623218 RepID=A0ABW4B1C8_9GAMM
MLLINICVLVGAILTPPSLWWLYSTHIALLCLYQLRMGNWSTLTFIGFSLIALTHADVWRDWFVSSKPNDVPGILYADARCYVSEQPLALERVYILQGQERFYAKPCAKEEVNGHGQSIVLRLPDRFGQWAGQYGYGKHVGAIAFAPVTHSPSLSESNQYFSQFSSWAFSLSLIKGDRTFWSERDKWLINYLGLTHLFVVSGLHVGFVCFLAIWAVKLLWYGLLFLPSGWKRFPVGRRWLEFVLAVPACLAYTLWSGSGEPAIRASLMAFVFLGIRATYRAFPSALVLAMCAWLMLLQWPGRALDASFWLSFGFVLLLIWLAGRTPEKGKFLIVQCLLSLFAVLLTWGWQNSISSITVLANLVMIPFVAAVWFPAALLSYGEYSLWGKSFVYPWLDSLLVSAFQWSYGGLAWSPDIQITQPVDGLQKLLVVLVAFLGVFYLPLLRGGVLLIGAFVLLFWRVGEDDVSLVIGTDRGALTALWPNRAIMERGEVMVIAPNVLAIQSIESAQQIISDQWRLVVVPQGQDSITLLQALSVKTLEIPTNERFTIRYSDAKYTVQAASCFQVLNLLKTDGCEHAETLESVLN